jgi:hypothetical protein
MRSLLLLEEAAGMTALPPAAPLRGYAFVELAGRRGRRCSRRAPPDRHGLSPRRAARTKPVQLWAPRRHTHPRQPRRRRDAGATGGGDRGRERSSASSRPRARSSAPAGRRTTSGSTRPASRTTTTPSSATSTSPTTASSCPPTPGLRSPSGPPSPARNPGKRSVCSAAGRPPSSRRTSPTRAVAPDRRR